MSKVFGIGFSRTGTFALHVALQVLYFRSVHFPMDLNEIHTHEAALDTTVTCGYQFLDVMYPDAKFILTLRNPDTWVESMIHLWEGEPTNATCLSSRLRWALFRDTPFNAQNSQRMKDALNRHTDSVREYFSRRPQSLLEMNISEGDGWEVLCPFVKRPMPKVPFPNVKRV